MNRLEAARWTSARPTGNSHELEVGQAPTTSFASSGTRPIVVQEAPAILTSLPKPGPGDEDAGRHPVRLPPWIPDMGAM